MPICKEQQFLIEMEWFWFWFWFSQYSTLLNYLLYCLIFSSYSFSYTFPDYFYSVFFFLSYLSYNLTCPQKFVSHLDIPIIIGMKKEVIIFFFHILSLLLLFHLHHSYHFCFFSFPSLFSLFLFLFHLPFHPQSAPDLTSNSSLHSMFEFSTPHFFRTSFHLTCLAYSLQLPALLLIFLHPPISPFSLLPNMLSQSSFPSPRHIFLTNKLLQFFLPPIYPHPLNLFPLRSPPFIYFRVFYISCFLFSLCSILIRAL